MPYLNCPRCELAIRLRDDAVDMRECPRCNARAGLAVPLFRSDALLRYSLLEPRPSTGAHLDRPVAPPGA
jgi:hypothetical protein